MEYEDIPRRLKRFYRQAEKRGEPPPNYEDFYGQFEEGSGREGTKEIVDELQGLSPEERKSLYREHRGRNREEKKRIVQEIRNFKNRNKREPSKNEVDAMAESIFPQVKIERNERSGGKGRRGKEDGNEVRPLREPKEKQSFEDLLKEGENKGMGDEMGLGLGDLEKELGMEEEGEELKELKEFSEKEPEKNLCPSCGKKTEKIIYCPSCGNAFCLACAKDLEKGGGRMKYRCPKCGKRFTVQE